MIPEKKQRIYTRKGDSGETSLLGGIRVPKYSLKVECYGTVDELNAVIGMLRDQPECKPYLKTLCTIQDKLFSMESFLAAGSAEDTKNFRKITAKDVQFLEKQIDRMESDLPVITHFVIPGGHAAVSWAHIARTVCRRAERLIVRLAEKEKIQSSIVPYINRLSDYLFVLARRLVYDLKIKEIPWRGKK